MSIYCLIYSIVALILIFGLMRFLFKSKPLPMQLYLKGLQAENNGKFYEATVIYEDALREVEKFRFHRVLQKAIVEKIKLLKQINKYGIDQNFIRSNNSSLEV